MSAEWVCAYRSPGRDTEAWELRHRSGALLAEVDTLREDHPRSEVDHAECRRVSAFVRWKVMEK